MQWSYPELRQRLITAELWPQGRMARLACYLAALAIGLFGLMKLLGCSQPPGEPIWAAGSPSSTSSPRSCSPFLRFRWLKRRILWRLRNRLIVTYVFIGVIPAVLLVGHGHHHPLRARRTVRRLRRDLRNRLAAPQPRSRQCAVSNELAARLERGENSTPESLAGLRKRDPAWGRRQVCAWYGEQAAAACAVNPKEAGPCCPRFLRRPISRASSATTTDFTCESSPSMPVGSNKLTVVTSETV